jgi:hypothetical protein
MEGLAPNSEWSHLRLLITFSYAIFSVAFLVLIYAASMSGGTASGEFASMTVFHETFHLLSPFPLRGLPPRRHYLAMERPGAR